MLSAIDIHRPLSMKHNKNHVFAIDTNALLWTFYGKASFARDSRSRYYSGFISDLIANKNKLIVTTINLSEMLHVIEKNECDLYYQGTKDKPNLKNFRDILAERNRLKQEFQLILKQLNAIPELEIVSLSIHKEQITDFCNRYDEHGCDFFDFTLIEYCNANNYSIIGYATT